MLVAGGFVLLCLIAAIVFDVGQNLLDRRAEQNSADAAALAGARYVVGATYVYHGGCSTVPAGVMTDPSSMPAVKAACLAATANGYVDGANDDIVRVDFPPLAPSSFSGLPGHLQVTIRSSRSSFFAGITGATIQNTAAAAVATNDSDIPLPYSLLALDPTSCGINKINGAPGTAVTTDGTVHIDSSCTTAGGGALLLSGNGVLTAPECDAVGELKTTNNATNNCVSAPTGVLVSGDPLKNLPPPTNPGLPAAGVQALDGGTIPSGCPGGSSPATESSPALCAFSTNGQKNKTFRIFPGSYPGGIEVTRATVYMDPGVYYIGGGGITIKSTGGAFGSLISKATGDNAGANPTGGVLIYNTTNATGGGYASIHLNAGDGSTLALGPMETGRYEGMVIFVDRTAGAGGADDIDLNGGGSSLDVSGTIYAPTGMVKLNGSSTDVVSAQVICYDFQVNGSGSAFTIDYNPDGLFHLKGVGLVE